MHTCTVTLTEAGQLLGNLPAQWGDETLVITCDNRPLLTLMTCQTLLANIESLQTLLEIMLGAQTGVAPRPASRAAIPAKPTSWE
ncbi:MAG TPA: hypothetical protein VGF67_19230 [Ktedonobacteraceae bacterium]|jgi:hypothetical protein